MDSSPPVKVKAPLPMVPVPQALETVLIETAKSLWLRRDDDDTSASTPYHQLVGRISAMDVRAPAPGYPDHNSSIMDGYAVQTGGLAAAKEAYEALDPDRREGYVLDFVVAGKVYAGDDGEEGGGREANAALPDISQRTAVYVTTGAVVPRGYDAVIPVEDTTAQQIHGVHTMQIIPSKIESVVNSTKPWTWIRTVGIDIPPDSVVLSKGEVIQPVHLALMGQVGIGFTDVRVKMLPRVGVLSTGNELLSLLSDAPAESQQTKGKIPDANRPLLLTQLSTYGSCVPVDLGIATDDEGYESIARQLNHELWPAEGEGIDVLITTGGISMGEKDIMERVFVEGMGGKVHFGRMNMKPGKPTTFITIDRDGSRKLVFALPGNPVSASVCTELLVRPCLDLLHHGVDSTVDRSDMESFAKQAAYDAMVHEEVMATIASDIKLDQGRPEYRRVALERVPSNDDTQQYTYTATSTGVQRSSRVLSLRGANGLMVLPRGGASGCGYDVAKKGMQFPVLMHSPLSSASQTRFKDSMHRAMWKRKHHHHHAKLVKQLALGVIVCVSDESDDENNFQSIDTTLVNSLGGDSRASVVKRAICKVPRDSKENAFAQQFAGIVNGPPMEGANVIFVILPTAPRAEHSESSSIAFTAGLEVSHALRPLLTKSAHAMALQVRKHAAAIDPVAALFENVVGTVRDGSSVAITCSDKGFEGAVASVKGLLGHLTSLINPALKPKTGTPCLILYR